YTDLDFAGGVDRLVAAALQDGPAAGDAADLLTQLDVDVSGALVAAWPRLSPQGKRRAVRVLAAQSLRGRGSIELLVRAVQDPDADVSRAGLDAMLAALPASEPMLEGLVGQAGALADRVIAALVRKAPTQAVALGLRAVSAPGGSERPKLREAVAAGLEHAGALGVQAASAWIEAQPGPSVEARASAALAFSSTNAGLALAARLLGMSLEAAKAFPEQWRLLAAARSVPSEPAADAWLVQLATTAEPWMLRVAALQALAERHSAAAPSVATKALTDANPRVRSAALASLASAAGGVELLSKYARDDKWFLVRTAALDALPEGAGAEPVLRAALGDRAAVVRAAAVRGLRRVRSVAAWPAVAPHVENAQEYPEVIAEGIGFARALCVQDAAPALQGVVTRGLRPDAWGPDQELALGALETLGILGGKPGAWALEQARSPVVPPSVRTSIERNAKAATPCTPQP
ncbi:MAG TPA: HEAT repeat domain-containing protein, partial [Polyangiales bacterium]